MGVTVIQVRGTSGSGKTFVMKSLMKALGEWTPQFRTGRKRPLCYVLNGRHPKVAVLGAYETACGGCDGIGSAREVYELIQSLTKDIGVVLCEGLLLSEDSKWSSQLKDLRVLYLTTPLERCLSQIRSRRKEAGNEKPLKVENTSRRVGVIERSRVKLIDLGVCCRRGSSEQAVNILLDWLNG